MTPPTIAVFVRMEKRALASRWADHEWRAAAIEPSPGAPADTERSRVFGPIEVSLHRDEAEGYFLNTSSGAARAFVMWRLGDGGLEGEPQVCSVTLSYNEAARLMDAQERVDAVPLPALLASWLEGFVAEHYRPEPKKKRVKASFLAPGERGRL